MKKLIKTNKGIQEMTLEEVIDSHINLARQFINSHKESYCNGIIYSYDDFYQEVMLSLMKSYERYDISHNCNFSTFADNGFKNVLNDKYNYLKMQKRTGKTISMDVPVGEDQDTCLGDLLRDYDVDVEMESISKVMLDSINEQLNDKEKEDLKVLLAKEKNSGVVSEYARATNVSRQAVSKRLKKLQAKLQNILK